MPGSVAVNEYVPFVFTVIVAPDCCAGCAKVEPGWMTSFVEMLPVVGIFI